MSENKGLFSRFFGGDTKSGCCSIRIEEIPEDEQSKKAGRAERGQDAEAAKATTPCCGGGKPTQDTGCC